MLLIIGLPLLILMLSGQPICFAMCVSGIIGIYACLGLRFADAIAYVAWNTTNSFVLTALPLFIFMGEIILHTKLSTRLYSGISLWLDGVPGGLLYSNIIACAIFSTMSGSSVATAATVGSVAIPELEKRGYERKLTVGSIAAGGTLGILIPPSIPLIVYGSLVQESVGKLFIGAFIPGVMTAILYMLVIFIIILLWPRFAPLRQEGVTWERRILGLSSTLPVITLILAVLGTIYLGIATPTEAAALGAFLALVLSLIYRELSLKSLKESLMATVQTTSMVLFILVGALIISFVLANLAVPRQLIQFIASLHISSMLVLGCIYLLYLILGCFFDGMSIMVLTLAIVFPLVTDLGWSPLWFGVILVIVIESSLITPPVALNLYVIKNIAPQYSLSEISIGSMPFFLVNCLMLAILTAFPKLVLWLPSLMFTPSR